MKSARINFGIPDSEYILEVDDTGAATSLVNQDTGTEYVGGGGGSLYKSARVTFDITDNGAAVADIWDISFNYNIYFGDHIDEFNVYEMSIRSNNQTTPAVVELPIVENQPCYIGILSFAGSTTNEATFFYDVEGQGVTVEGAGAIVDLANGVISITGDCIIHLPILWD